MTGLLSKCTSSFVMCLPVTSIVPVSIEFKPHSLPILHILSSAIGKQLEYPPQTLTLTGGTGHYSQQEIDRDTWRESIIMMIQSCESQHIIIIIIIL